MASTSTDSAGGNLYWVKPDFLVLLKTVGAKEKILPIKEVLDYLNKYISVNSLYNKSEPLPPKTFYLNDDPLAKVFGVKQFNIPELKKLLPYLLIPVPNKIATSDNAAQTVIESERSSLLKRKLTEDEKASSNVTSNDSNKKVKVDPVPFPFGTFLYPSFPKYISGDETDSSVQGVETDCVRDSGDDVLLYEGAITVSEYHDLLDNIHSSDDDDDVGIEYEVESVSSLSSNYSDTSSDTEDIMYEALVIVKDDSDVPFWADESDEDTPDPELSIADKWSCSQCGSLNDPLNRYCQRCWDRRVHWLPEKNKNHPPTNLKKKQRLKIKERPIGKVLPMKSLMSDTQSSPNKSEEAKEKLISDQSLASTSQESSSLNEFSQDSGIMLQSEKAESQGEYEMNGGEEVIESTKLLKLCPICQRNLKTGIFVHGSTSHQYCCYKCAKVIQKSGKPCPICRRKIGAVVRNFII